ncbi:MAG: 30S ribosomal protein S17 [Candidatus Raymondbacteria bacterium RifOxyA12_full_50_37]|uniref:Small ribosomal subunit protein uS17 n=1 Tax=Candidatus Raymondbacteria bacterium RIFOXYD12_FULL_49_13 TaxID=1817890 RepID=A0A1F7FD52_UNCRA|nr:ribosomal protein S17 [uncultured bacterium]OGJ88086.1 MAG: 30S ribosomal protein S17 [Candidatus Raymondbacteria bacterium RifOxyA12_full_50_37]OGJ94063.1 MAG: 30S ribosomal protein S17 [Candidatus Raymondbacteria bacterium RIFOXYA2_FULL_49_16]OGJ96818.1 MAG: 30S ribosomal protein S17 [Candidatus Raymondbacteria bacterium RifOxyC12_full_50_8]OGJ96888.1 MAG: 30S ribosomal protein S17 [Candidatus Raymondbacteria bacterium RIFOXYC2_FULL_50_21]OGK04615.1 MAG: 30S ribosomal protein S17 [Candida
MDRNKRRVRTGIVIKNAMDKSIVVKVERAQAHLLYDKVVKKKSTFMAHDDKNECNIGDLVEIAETRPLSKMKRWRLTRIIQKVQ